MKPRILVIDDEVDLVNLLQYNLTKSGYDVISAYDGNSALDLAWTHRPDLLILDLMLPDRSGYDICKEIKQDDTLKNTPIIMLTARSSENDRITGFESGAEDYVIKPFSPKELVLRVKTILARTKAPNDKVVLAGTLQIYPDQYRVLVDEKELNLTQTEFNLLMTLVRNPDRVKTREQLLQEVWNDGAEEVMDRAVDTQIKRLRHKLGTAKDMIKTIRGIGYRFTAPNTSSIS